MTPEQIPPEEIDRIYKNENDTSFWKKVSLMFIWKSICEIIRCFCRKSTVFYKKMK